MGTYRVDPSVLSSEAQKMNDTQVSFQQEYNNMYNNLDQLTQNGFVSVAANAYRQALSEYQPKFQKMRQTIENYGVYCLTVINDTDSMNDNIISQIGKY